jgi:hypothetical protein
MDIELTEEEQKIYDNLVKYTSGEYRDTELDILMACFGSISVNSKEFDFTGGDFYEQVYSYVLRWWSDNREMKLVSSKKYIKIDGWRKLITKGLHREFSGLYRIGQFKEIKIRLSMGEFELGKNDTIPAQQQAELEFTQMMSTWNIQDCTLLTAGNVELFTDIVDLVVEFIHLDENIPFKIKLNLPSKRVEGMTLPRYDGQEVKPMINQGEENHGTEKDIYQRV